MRIPRSTAKATVLAALLGALRLTPLLAAVHWDGGGAAESYDDEEPGAATSPEHIERVVAELRRSGAAMTGATMRSARGGAIKKVLLDQPPGTSFIPVVIDRPTSELLPPPEEDTNPHACYNDVDERPGARTLRVPCFLACEGPSFDPRWGHFRSAATANAVHGQAYDRPTLEEIFELVDEVARNDSAIILGRLRFMARIRHEFTSDSHLDGFCLYGVATALFTRAQIRLASSSATSPSVLGAPEDSLEDLEIAFALLSDTNSLPGIEFSFLENSGWPLWVEDLIVNLQAQRLQLGVPFRLVDAPRSRPMLRSHTDLVHSSSLKAIEEPLSLRAGQQQLQLRLCGIGDHLTATYDTMLMVTRSLEAAADAAAGGGWSFHRDYLGRYCPKHKGQSHQCRQRCELLGLGCGQNGEEDEEDPISLWIDGIIDAESLEELPYSLTEKAQLLQDAATSYERLATADLLVCSHPTLLCVLLALVTSQPMFVHASSSLLYGIGCDACGVHGSTLRRYDDVPQVGGYLLATRELLQQNRFVLFAEGAFLAKQFEHQVQVAVPWLPPLALYVPERIPAAEPLVRALVLRSRFFVTLAGELLRCLLREIGSINPGRVPAVTFLGVDNQFDEQWLTLEQIAGYAAAVLYPNDVHQRTFHELYAMGIPIFMPDALGLFRLQRMANWGYTSYGASLQAATTGEEPNEAEPQPWWNSFTASPEVVMQLQTLADWEQFPLVQRFASLPGLLDALLETDLTQIAEQMLVVRQHMRTEAMEGLVRPVLRALQQAP